MKGIDENELKKGYPHLHKEMADDADDKPEGGSSRRVGVVRLDRGRCYEPSVLDFIQRCSTNEEALEIICFMEKRGEISRAYAESLKKRVSEKGVRSFGVKRLPGHYERVLR